MEVGIYVRVACDGSGLDAQVEKLQEEARINCWTVVDIYKDQCSGRTMDRPALQRMLRDISIGRIRGVLVSDTTRLSRTPSGLAELLRVFGQQKVTLMVHAEKYDTSASIASIRRVTMDILEMMVAKWTRD